jgi:hypothetical protein
LALEKRLFMCKDRGWDNVYRGKYHYFLYDGHSICGKYHLILWPPVGYLPGDVLPDKEKCKACMRRLAKREKATPDASVLCVEGGDMLDARNVGLLTQRADVSLWHGKAEDIYYATLHHYAPLEHEDEVLQAKTFAGLLTKLERRYLALKAADIAYAIDIAETEAAKGHLEPWPPEPG